MIDLYINIISLVVSLPRINLLTHIGEEERQRKRDAFLKINKN